MRIELVRRCISTPTCGAQQGFAHTLTAMMSVVRSAKLKLGVAS
jgi:hypothetical protein